MLAIFFQAFIMALGLIIAIGAQNIFIIKIGLQQHNVMLAAFTAAFCDASMIILGTLFMSWLTVHIPLFLPLTKWLGCLYLLFYGLLSTRNALRKEPKGWNIVATEWESKKQSTPLSAHKIIISVLLFSYLNPHAIIDTLIVLGNVGAKLSGELQWAFILGATAASFVWFFVIGFSAKRASAFFTRLWVARLFDFVSAIIMFFIAYRLFTFDVTGNF